MGYNPKESLENTINTMGTLLGVRPIVPWFLLHVFWTLGRSRKRLNVWIGGSRLWRHFNSGAVCPLHSDRALVVSQVTMAFFVFAAATACNSGMEWSWAMTLMSLVGSLCKKWCVVFSHFCFTVEISRHTLSQRWDKRLILLAVKVVELNCFKGHLHVAICTLMIWSLQANCIKLTRPRTCGISLTAPLYLGFCQCVAKKWNSSAIFRVP